MGTSAAKFKIMPSNVDANLKEISENAKEIIEEMGGTFTESNEEPIAFGLKALIISLAYPEEKEIDELENKLNQIKDVSSAELIDYRRAVG